MYTKEEIRIKALEALLDNNIASLPVNLHQDGVIIRSMQFLSEFWEDSLQSYTNLWGEHGILAYDPINKICAIYINEDEPLEIQRWYIAIGIAHIKLGALRHLDSPAYFRLEHTGSELSANAEEFTYSFICPDVILDLCKIKTPQDIIKYCKIPFGKANIKAKRMKKYNCTGIINKNLKSTLESNVSMKFETFLKQFGKDKM